MLAPVDTAKIAHIKIATNPATHLQVVGIAAHPFAFAIRRFTPHCTGFAPQQPTKPTQRYGAGNPFCVAEERRADRIRAGVV